MLDTAGIGVMGESPKLLILLQAPQSFILFPPRGGNQYSERIYFVIHNTFNSICYCVCVRRKVNA